VEWEEAGFSQARKCRDFLIVVKIFFFSYTFISEHVNIRQYQFKIAESYTVYDDDNINIRIYTSTDYG